MEIMERDYGLRLKKALEGETLVYYQETDSTNLRGKELGIRGVGDRTVIISDFQHQGRGRMERQWVAPPGECIFMTLVLRPALDMDRLSGLTLVTALGLARGISEVTDCQPGIKWPNDIILNKKKIGGILTEVCHDPGGGFFIVTGAGVNVNQREFPPELAGKASSLFLETGKKTDRVSLVRAILRAFDGDYREYVREGSLKNLVETYQRLLVNRGKYVKIIEKSGTFEALAEGIDYRGGLVVRNSLGERKTIISGEVSVRGMEGYL